MKTLLPPTGIMSLRKEMDRVLDRFWDGDDFPNMGEWTPSMDLSESKDLLSAKVEVPGIDPKDIHVTLENGILTVTGEKRREAEQKDERFYRMERGYGSFARSLKLPMPVDAAKVNATFKNGVLTITMPKAAEAKGTNIPVKLA